MKHHGEVLGVEVVVLAAEWTRDEGEAAEDEEGNQARTVSDQGGLAYEC